MAVAGGSVMVWACFTSHATGVLHIIDGKMDSAMYSQILEKSIIPSEKRLFKNSKWTVQQEKDPISTRQI